MVVSDLESDDSKELETYITKLNYEDVNDFIVLATGDAKNGH